MRTAPNPLTSAAGLDLSATLLRLRGVAIQVARRRLESLHRATRAAPRARRSGARALQFTAALIGFALAVALTIVTAI